MAVLVGIDEAGFGPLLGPLVVSSASFTVPDPLVSADFWQLLKKSVSVKRRHLAGRLLVTDSKKAYSKSLGIKHLQRTVLACCKCLGKNPTTLAELINILCEDSLERLKGYPWHQSIANHSIHFDASDIDIAATVFKDEIAANGIQLRGIQSCCLDVAYYNRMVSEIKNKSSVLISTTSRLIRLAYDSCEDDCMQFLVDRQGGRAHYRKNLQLIFPDVEPKILRESDTVSSYELKDGRRTAKVHFVVAADKKFLPVSLASMVSKYLRELLVENMNSYFTTACSGLRPTAGYWQDGLRFIADLKNNFPDFKYDSNQLIRCR